MENIIRKPYLDKIEQALGKDIIIVLVGQRRIGKSYLLGQLKDEKAPVSATPTAMARRCWCGKERRSRKK